MFQYALSLLHRAQRKATESKLFRKVPFPSPLPSALHQLKGIGNSSTMALIISTGNVSWVPTTVGFTPLRAVCFQSALVAAAAAVHTSLLKKRNTGQHWLYHLLYTCVCMYAYLYIYASKQDNNQEVILRLDNVMSPFSHKRQSFSHWVELGL